MSSPLETHEIPPSLPLSRAHFQEILARSSGPIAFRGHKGADPSQASWDRHDVTVIVSNPNANRRGAGDLIVRLWAKFPRVAALLKENLSSQGAVVFSANARTSIANSEENPDTAIANAIARGMTFHAIMEPSEAIKGAPEDPPPLTPLPLDERKQRWSQIIKNTPPSVLVDNAANQPDAQAILAGLLLWNDDLHASHAISQSIEGKGRHVAGDYWHAIMHRREPDYGNAKYWFRRAGTHPIHTELAERAATYLKGTPWRKAANNGVWDAARFVDACREAEQNGDSESVLALRRCQSDEMLLLLEHTCRDATD